MSNLHKNSIITGYIDSYCLVCDSYLRSEEDAIAHVGKPLHKKNLDLYQYLEKYKDDHIRKVKKGYFCEYCNVLLSTVAKAGLHVTEECHSNNKGSQLLKRIGSCVIAADNIFIDEKAWNGLIDYTCAICNTEFYNENIHKTERKHVINLIEKKVEFGAKMSIIYRKIDETSFQCLTCNMIYSLNMMTSHFDDENHKRLYAKCCHFKLIDAQLGLKTEKTITITETKSEITDTEKIKLKMETPNENTIKGIHEQYKKTEHEPKNQFETDKNPAKPCIIESTISDDTKIATENLSKAQPEGKINEDSKTKSNLPKSLETAEVKASLTNEDGPPKKETIKEHDKEKILNNVSEFQKNGVKINFETETAFCKKCFENVALNFEDIERHIEEHKTIPNKAAFRVEYAVNEKYSKTILNDEKNKEQNANLKEKSREHLDQNHNITKDCQSPITEKVKHLDGGIIKNKALTERVPVLSIENETNTDIPKPSKEKEINEIPDISQNDPSTFAKANQLTFNKGNNNAFCRICNIRMPSSLRNMKEHVAGAAHKKAAKVSATKSTTPKRALRNFIRHMTCIENLFYHDVVINDKYCLDKLSYEMISKQEHRFRCQVCEENLMQYEMDDHVESYTHETALGEIPVVWSLDTEFVREVRSGLFHCGFCNLIMGSWEEVPQHLQCAEHDAARSRANRRLRNHLPSVLRHRRERDRHFMDMFLGRFGF